MMMAAVPVLLVTGPVGAGKSTVAAEAARLLREAEVPHALIDLAHIGESFPAPPDDPWNERLIQRNLACLWANYQEAGAERLILSRVLEARSLLRFVSEAVPGADIRVVRLRVGLETLHARIHAREAGRDPTWYLEAATYLADELEHSHVEDYVVDNQDRSASETAAAILQVIGWLAPDSPR